VELFTLLAVLITEYLLLMEHLESLVAHYLVTLWLLQAVAVAVGSKTQAVAAELVVSES
jgi:hypothetical protein